MSWPICSKKGTCTLKKTSTEPRRSCNVPNVEREVDEIFSLIFRFLDGEMRRRKTFCFKGGRKICEDKMYGTHKCCRLVITSPIYINEVGVKNPYKTEDFPSLLFFCV
ncbi:hypothetical protein L1987_24732 [Smallanthus sonchifolius]|uniref:Uncharacterized protein n=1 Tax=Smallanthus sonchifolius TaxID=185202 RepID=A0ACB9IMQ8_9ASTR|nr:hypothetical protein L1987_24732 [Smallanthus sonchifolius]